MAVAYNLEKMVHYGKPDNPVVTELQEYPPMNICKISENLNHQAQYRIDCMNGDMHPLRIEYEHYQFVEISNFKIDTFLLSNSNQTSGTGLHELDTAFVQSVIQEPKVQWAIDNSFDGLYVMKCNDVYTLTTSFSFKVYLKEEHATFWRLKYSG